MPKYQPLQIGKGEDNPPQVIDICLERPVGSVGYAKRSYAGRAYRKMAANKI